MKNYDEYKNSVELANKANEAYYKNSEPIMSDLDFDKLMADIVNYEKENPNQILSESPTQKVGDDLIQNSKKHTHPMLSLENTYNTEDVKAFIDSVLKVSNNTDIVIQPKYDGCSVAITFKDGKVVKALTRGNGEYGEDITENIKLLNWSVDNRSKICKDFNGEVRGELMISNSGFAILNKDNEYQNPRNLVSGTIKLLDRELFKKRAPYIVFKPYWFFPVDPKLATKDYVYDLNLLGNYGFDNGIEDTYLNNINDSIDSIISSIMQLDAKKNNFDYTIDGAVIKVCDKTVWEKLGCTSKYPRYAKAYKFKQEEVETIVESIEYQVGRTGKITPCCNFKPVTIDGSTISRCTLNNIDYMNLKDVRVGDTIIVHKAAAIIPEIVSVVLEKRPSNSKKEEFIKTCPICGSHLIKDESKADHFCSNINCKARALNSIEYYCKALEIDGFGPVIIESLYNKGILNSILDLYKLNNYTAESLNIYGFGQTTLDKLIEQIELSKTKPAWMLLSALGIPTIGKRMSKLLIEKFGSINKIIEAKLEDFNVIDGFGLVKSMNIYEFMQNSNNKAFLLELSNNNCNFGNVSSNNNEKLQNSAIIGKSFCITGALSRHRKEIEEMIESLGGKNASSVTSKTDYLVTNDKTSGSSKNKKAAELNIPIISETELYDLLQVK